MSTANSISTAKKPGRLWFFVGLACAILGIAAYLLQVSLQHLTTPWYLPFTALIGLVFVWLSLSRQKTIWRRVAFFAVACVAGAEGTFLYGVRLPAYAGPLELGKPYPAFQTQRADATPFTQADFKGNENTVLVFFRGRW